MRLPRRRQRQGTTCHGSPTFGVSVGLRAATTALAALLGAVALLGAAPWSLGAQDAAPAHPTTESEGVADNALLARFELPREALDGVTSSVELVAALREHLTIDLAMPLDEPLVINLHGLAGRREGGQGPVYHFGLSPLGVGFQGEGRLDDFSYALAVRESHGEDFPRTATSGPSSERMTGTRRRPGTSSSGPSTSGCPNRRPSSGGPARGSTWAWA